MVLATGEQIVPGDVLRQLKKDDLVHNSLKNNLFYAASLHNFKQPLPTNSMSQSRELDVAI